MRRKLASNVPPREWRAVFGERVSDDTCHLCRRGAVVVLAARAGGGACLNCPLCNHVLLDGSDPAARVVAEEPSTWGTAHWCPICKLPFVKGRVRELGAEERPFAEGDRVLVEGARGEAPGIVAHAATPYELPHLGMGSSSHEAHQIMHEFGVDFVILIRRPDPEGDLMFFALHHPGGWRDLHGQDLRITKVRSEKDAA